ncbi:MAG: 3-hydroxyacyl-CoA dehydrogenase family protein, partial [Ilumatobacteraceae bacterium]
RVAVVTVFSMSSEMNIAKVGICGSGIMGSGLAEVAAKAGYTVVVRSRSAASAQAMITTIEKGLDKQVAREKITADDKAAILGRLSATDKIADLADCDLVIESVVEDLAVKKALFAELDKAVKPGAILATNTSTLPVVEMAMATGRPDKVCGIHFFNPATAMPLVEVVRPITASDDTMAAANAFTAKCGKSGVQVKDRAGFIVNALLFPYLNNAIRIWETGTASMEDIDTAMKGGCNFPMGPFALLDLVGLDTSLAILEALYAEFADANYAAVPTLRRLVAAGKLGRKSGEGFYTY